MKRFAWLRFYRRASAYACRERFAEYFAGVFFDTLPPVIHLPATSPPSFGAGVWA